MDYNLDEIIEEINFEKNMHKKINNMLLTENQIEVLNRYNIDYNRCTSMSELLYYIDIYRRWCYNKSIYIDLN